MLPVVKKLKKAIRMYNYYQAPIEGLLGNILDVCDDYDVSFVLPIVVSMAMRKVDFVCELAKSKRFRVASHGYRHIRYPQNELAVVSDDITKSAQTFLKLGIKVDTFRAPYNNYRDDMIGLLAKEYMYDIGYFYADKYQDCQHPVDIEGLTCFPVSQVSDDWLLDKRGLNVWDAMGTIESECFAYAADKRVVCFDLHPIRIGLKKNIPILRRLCDTVLKTNGCIITPDEYEAKVKQDYDYYVILSGDIDQWGFLDYLRR